METLRTAVRYGADAVYSGGKQFSLRAKAKNFSLPELQEAIRFAHGAGVRVYVTANIFAHDAELDGAAAFFDAMAHFPREAQPDALLIADPGMLLTAREHCPGILVHLSTQANTTNAEACRFWQAAGVSRIVTARELSLTELITLRERIPGDLELECFVHGAMCISYSGRCLLSRAMTGRDANHGACAHPCRYHYALVEEKRPGEYFAIEEEDGGTEILASDDLCMLAHLPELVEAGIDSFKVEGRMKNALYVASVARAYRRAIDLLCDPGRQADGSLTEEGREAFRQELPALLEEVRGAATRPMGTGFFFGDPDGGGLPDDPGRLLPAEKERVFLGVVETAGPDDSFVIEQRNRFAVGDEIRVMKPCGRQGLTDLRIPVTGILGADGLPVEKAVHPREKLCVTTGGDTPPEPGDVLYRI
ncbi:MAG: U32 family peptidase [Lachnospiraceae bacterium]|nr:U32 family peptidase [Lachnospiraceae bacterium]